MLAFISFVEMQNKLLDLEKEAKKAFIEIN
jgi:hypothetical protein